MRIAILGSGLIGGKLGTLFARADHEVTFSYSHSMDKLEGLAADAGNGAKAGSPAQAVKGAKVVLLAVHWSKIDDVLKLAGDLAGKIVISCSLPMTDDDSALAVGHRSSGAEKLAAKLLNAHVVSAFSSVQSEVLLGVFKTKDSTPRPTLIYCGDNSVAKKTAAKLIANVGFVPLDAGNLKTADISSHFRCWWRRSLMTLAVPASHTGLNGNGDGCRLPIRKQTRRAVRFSMGEGSVPDIRFGGL